MQVQRTCVVEVALSCEAQYAKVAGQVLGCLHGFCQCGRFVSGLSSAGLGIAGGIMK